MSHIYSEISLRSVRDAQSHCFERQLQEKNKFWLKVRGFSMWPFLKDGDMVLVRKARMDELSRGDIVLTYVDGRFYCHRVFKKNRLGLVTKADALVGFDAVAGHERLLGKVVARESNGKKGGLDTPVQRTLGVLIAWGTFLAAPFYPWAGRVRRCWRGRSSKKPAMADQAIEDLLVYFLSRPEKKDIVKRMAQESFTEADLDRLFVLSCREGLSGWLYAFLEKRGSREVLPERTWLRLKEEFFANYGRNMLLAKELDDVYAALEKAAVPTLVVRGGVFFKSLYDSLGMRPMIDCDLIFPQKDLSQAQSLLSRNGYEPFPGFPSFWSKGDVYLDLHLNAVGFSKIPHWPVPIGFKTPQVMADTCALNGRRAVRTLGRIDTVLSCCDHLQAHSFSRLIGFLDVILLLEDFSGTDWREFLARAQQYHLKPAACFVLSFLDHYGLVYVPEEVLSRLKGFHWHGVQSRAFQQLLHNQRRTLPGEWLCALSVPGLKTRLRIFKSFLFRHDHPLTDQGRHSWGEHVLRFVKLFGFCGGKVVGGCRVHRPL